MTKKKLSLSPTRINAFLECRLKYKFIYTDKIGRFYYQPNPGNAFGGTLHRVLQAFHQPGAEQVPVENLLQQYQEAWVASGFADNAQEEEFKAAGERILREYHASGVQERAKTILAEKMIKWDMDDFVLSGRIDRMDEHADGSLEIIDYKSGRLSSTEEEVKNSLAMSVYQLIAKKLYPDRRIFASIHCLAGGVKASAELNDVELIELEESLRRIASTIMNAVEYEPNVSDACRGCDFHRLCSKQPWFRSSE
ncbi:MAG: RecB family exonuclease [Armatimonadota bacterium]